MLAACRYFAAERVHSSGVPVRLFTGNRSFHILLAIEGCFTVVSETSECALARGRACLVPAEMNAYDVTGTGTFLLYYVPDLSSDVIEPLRCRGYSEPEIYAILGLS